MKVGRNMYDIACEMSNCKNVAKYRLIFDGELSHDLHICRDCLKKLQGELNSFFNEKGKKTEKQEISGS